MICGIRNPYHKIWIMLTLTVLFWWMLSSSGGSRSPETSGDSLSPEHNSLKRSLERHLLKTLEKSKNTPKELSLTSCQDRTNRTKIARSFRKLMKELILEESHPESYESDTELCHLSKDILGHPRITTMVSRVKHLQNSCKDYTKYDSTKNKLLQIKPYSLNICRNAKSASSALGVYTNALFVFNLLDVYASTLKSFSTHRLIQDATVIPESKGDETIVMEDKLNLVSVRHPFQRMLSAYLNKVYHYSAYKMNLPELYSEMQEFSVMKSDEAISYITKTLQKIYGRTLKFRNFDCPQKTVVLDPQTDNGTNSELVKGIPTFRGYALGVALDLLRCRGDTDCLYEKEKHFRSQAINCSPCERDFDIVVKAETLETDMLFIEELMNLPKAWKLQQEILAGNDVELKNLAEAISGSDGDSYSKGSLKANVSAREKTFVEYMSELSKEEMDIVYTAYYNDFRYYDYNPCDGL